MIYISLGFSLTPLNLPLDYSCISKIVRKFLFPSSMLCSVLRQNAPSVSPPPLPLNPYISYTTTVVCEVSVFFEKWYRWDHSRCWMTKKKLENFQFSKKSYFWPIKNFSSPKIIFWRSKTEQKFSCQFLSKSEGV